MRRMGLGLAILVVLLVVAGMAYVRLSPNDPARWHVDPMEAGRPGLANGFLVRPKGGDMAAPVFDQSPAALAAHLDAVARDWPGTRLFAGAPDKGWMTYITRSRWMGFPDFTSVRILRAPGGKATFAAFARARFGRSDLGVNEARLEGWLQILAMTR